MGFFLEPLQKSIFWGDILIIEKLAFEIRISQYTYDCQASCFIDVNLQWKELGNILVGSLGHHLQGALQITTLCWNDTYVSGFSGLCPPSSQANLCMIWFH